MFFFTIVCIPLIAICSLALKIAVVHIHFHFVCRIAAAGVDIITVDISSEFTLYYLKLSILSMRRYIGYFGDSHCSLCCRTTAVSRIRCW